MGLKTILATLLLTLPAVRALGVGHELRIHLRSGGTVAIPHDTIRRIQFQHLTSDVGQPVTVGGFQLLPNAPNPFNPATVLAFRLETEAPARLTIHDLRGALVRTLAQGRHPAGEHRQVWDGADQNGVQVASGVYLAVLESAGQVRTRKLLMVK
jgi:hypothetical protein